MPRQADFFERARVVVGTTMFLAGLCAVAGALLDWVAITPPPTIPPGQLSRAEPFRGIETTDGRVVLGAGIVLVTCAAWLVIRGRSGSGLLGALASIVIGGIAFADFRAILDPNSGLMRRMERVGEIDPGIGLVLGGVAAVLGLVASVAGVAAAPAAPRGEL